MEEDIKVLEENINNGTIYCLCGNTINKAIENLIARNKELEEMNEKYKIHLTDEQYLKIIDSVETDVNKEWKSKAEELLEKLDKEEKQELKGVKGQDRYFMKQIYQAKRNTIEELLQEGDK